MWVAPEEDCLCMSLSAVPAFSKHFISPMGRMTNSQEAPRERTDILLYILSKIKIGPGSA